MALINIFTNVPAKIEDTIQAQIDRVKKLTKNSNIRYNKDKLDKLVTVLHKEYTAWFQQTKPLRTKLIGLNELIECVVKDTNFPFEGASNLTMGYASGMARTFKSTFNKTAYQDPELFSATTKNESLKPDLASLEEAANYSFHTDSNGLDTLKNGTIPVLRDGTLIVTGYWDRRIESCTDSKNYKTFAEFVEDFPTAVSAGLSEEDFAGIADSFIIEPDTEVIANYQYDNILHDGPAYDIIPLAKFVFFPVSAKTLSSMKTYGREYTLTKAQILEKVKRNEFYKEQAEELVRHDAAREKDNWSASKNFIEGLSQNPADEKYPYKLVDCVHKADLDDDDIEEKYLVTFSPDSKKILSFKNYHLRNNVDFCVEFRLVKREDRFLGVSLIGENEDKFNAIDSLHRNRNNVRMLTTSPIVMINDKYKEQVDPFRSENIIRPGVSFWVNDINNCMKQLEIRNLDQPGNSIDEENLIQKYVEFDFGPTQAMSGKETATDPRAPMGKTIALLQQANQRIDDYLDVFRESMPRLIELHNTLLAQYGPDQINYNIEKDGELVVKSVERALFLNSDIKWLAKRRSVTLSPEYSMQRLGGLMATYGQLLQLIAMQDTRALEIWNRMVVASGEPNKEKLMIQVQPVAPGGTPGPGMVPGGGGMPPGGMPPLSQQVTSPSPRAPNNNLGT